MAALEAKRVSIDPIAEQDQGWQYAEQLDVTFVVLSNGEEVWFRDRETDVYARNIAGLYAQDGLERQTAARRVRRNLSTVAIDRKIVDCNCLIECIEALSAEVSCGRRRVVVEMATDTGKTRVALIKHSGRRCCSRFSLWLTWLTMKGKMRALQTECTLGVVIFRNLQYAKDMNRKPIPEFPA